MTKLSVVSSDDVAGALQQISDARVAIDPLPPLARGADQLKRVFENTEFGSALATGDANRFSSIWDPLKQRIYTTSPESPRAVKVRSDLGSLEGPTIEFIEAFPPGAQARDIGKELAALAPAGGSLYLGVDDKGRNVGLPLSSRAEIDRFEQRVRGIAKAADPAIRFNSHWLSVASKVILEIEIPSSGEPFHCFDRIPYIRDGSSSRSATQAEAVRAARMYLQTTNQETQETERQEFIDGLAHLVDELSRNLARKGRATGHPERKHLDTVIDLGEKLHIAPGDYGLMDALFKVRDAIEVQEGLRSYPSTTQTSNYQGQVIPTVKGGLETIAMFRHRLTQDGKPN